MTAATPFSQKGPTVPQCHHNMASAILLQLLTDFTWILEFFSTGEFQRLPPIGGEQVCQL